MTAEEGPNRLGQLLLDTCLVLNLRTLGRRGLESDQPAGDWASIIDVRAMCPHADAYGKRTVFNIHGNDYRLIARINYQHRTVYIRAVLTHEEYDEGDWKDGCESV